MALEKPEFDFDTPIDRRQTNSTKWGSHAVSREGLTSLSVADMDFAMDVQVLGAMHRRIEHPIFGYEFTPDNLNDVFAAWQLEHNGFEVDKENIVHLPGVVNGIALSILAFSNPEDGVVIQPPVYPPFFDVVEHNGRKLLQNPLLYDRESLTWSMDLKGLETLFVKENPKVMLLCNPHNPVGRVWGMHELNELAELCRCHGVMLISDDIHSDFIFSEYTYTPLVDAARDGGPGCVQLMSPDKTFGMTGLGLAFALVPDAEQRETLQRMTRAMGLSKVNIMASTAVQAAYAHGSQWFAAVLAYIEKNHQLFKEQLATRIPWARVSKAEGTFVSWVDLQASGLNHVALAHAIRHDAKLMLFDGLSFGENGEYFFRVNLACSRTVLLDAADAFSRSLTVTKDRGQPKISLGTVVDRRCCG
jgi:cysteine-S-conjugate beta-lyase